MSKNSKDHGIDKYHDFDPNADQSAQLKQIYADWADAYDDDNDNKLQTVSQPTTVTMLQRHCNDRTIDILDVGCGTGLVGHHLRLAGFSHYDGCDISGEMMRHAAKRGYRNLETITVGKPLPFADNQFDATLCVGVFTHGHLGPEGFDEMLRVSKPAGLICFTVNEGVWDNGFPQAISRLVQTGHWTVLEQEKRDYMVNEGVQGWYVTARKAG